MNQCANVDNSSRYHYQQEKGVSLALKLTSELTLNVLSKGNRFRIIKPTQTNPYGIEYSIYCLSYYIHWVYLHLHDCISGMCSSTQDRGCPVSLL